MYYISLQRKGLSDVYVCNTRFVESANSAQLFKDVDTAKSMIETHCELVTWISESTCISTFGVFVIIERPDDKINWVETVLDALSNLDDYVPYALHTNVRNHALINGAIDHDDDVIVIMTYETTHVKVRGKLDSDNDALVCRTNDDTLISFIYEDVDNVDIVDDVITIYLEA